MTHDGKKQANRVAKEERMQRMIFVNLPVTDLERSKAFYEAIGFRNEPKFSNEAAAMMVLSDTISVMLLTHPFYATFTRKPIADANNSSQVMLCISCDSPAEVDRIVDAAAAAGGQFDQSLKSVSEPGSPMYGRDFEDPDGHQWEPLWMDPEFAEKGAHPVEDATAA
jgi:predicted lactoylglutathione lyase